MSNTPSPMISLYAPDGTLGEVPYERLHDALQAGAKMAVQMSAPDGTPGYVPADRTADAVKAGGKIIPFNSPVEQQGQRGFLGTMADKWKDITTPEAPMGPAQQKAMIQAGPGGGQPGGAQEIARQATRPLPSDLNNPLYRAATTLSPLVPALHPEASEAASSRGDTGAVLAEAAIPTAIAASPLAVEGLGKAVGSVLPSTSRAGAALGEVKAAAGNVPIDVSKVGDTALNLYEQSQRGATLPKVVRDFVNRVTKPGSDPITYAEAKDFQSNVSRLSANERMNLNPNTQRLLGQLNGNLKESLEGAADTVGKGQKFASAMKEYHDAMTLRGWTDTAKEYAWKGAVTAGLGALGYKAFKLIRGD